MKVQNLEAWIRVRLTKRERRELERAAAREGLRLSQFVRKTLRQSLDLVK